MAGKQQLSLTFALYQNDQLVGRETVSQNIIKVGRDPKSHLRIDDAQANRMHAVIEVQDDVTLIDLGNEAGTMVNGARVNKCKLSEGDQVQIGDTLIVLESIADASAVAAEPAAPAPEEAVAVASAAVAEAATAPAPVASNPFASGSSNPFGSPFGGSNPFASSPSASSSVADNAPEGSYEYQLLKSGPPVDDAAVETAANAVEVKISWGRTLLTTAHLESDESFFIGEELPELTEVGKHESFMMAASVVPIIGPILHHMVSRRPAERLARTAFFIPSEKLGAGRHSLVQGGAGGSSANVPNSATGGEVEINGQKQPVQAGQSIPLNTGTSVTFKVADFDFEVSAVNKGKKAVAASLGAALAGSAALYVIGSFLGHAGLLSAMAMFMPPLGDTSDDAISDEQRYLIKQYLESAAEKEMEEKETEQVSDDPNADNKEGGTGTRAKGEEGSMGNPNSKASGNRYGVAGPADNADPRIARQAALRDAAEFGMIGLLNSGAGGDPDAPTAPWGGEDTLGNDPLSARGNMWGDSIGESFGAGGLGLSGIGEGGGGRGEGIGLGNIGTIGHGAGTGTGQGFGSGHGRLGRSHRARPPRVRMGATQVSGRLPPEVIQRIVRQNFGRFRLCYENGLRNNPNLQGRVTVRFVIGRDGRVSNVGGGGDIPDSGVVSCVTRAFYGLSFPQPEGGIVTVGYPIAFSPGG